MAITFDQKNTVIYAKVQAEEGTPVTPEATTGIAVMASPEGISIDTEAHTFTGTPGDRHEVTSVKDTYITTPLQILMPTLASGGFNLASPSVFDLLKSCGVTVVKTSSPDSLTMHNGEYLPTFLTIDYYKFSAELAANKAKRQRFSDCRSTVDVELTVGSRAMLNFTVMGNSSVPTMETKLPHSVEQQLRTIAPVILHSNVTVSTLSELSQVDLPAVNRLQHRNGALDLDIVFATAHSAAAGVDVVVGSLIELSNSLYHNHLFTVTAVTSATELRVRCLSTLHAGSGAETSATATLQVATSKPVEISSLKATNFFGAAYERYLTSAATAFSRTSVPSDMMVTMLEKDIRSTIFNPETLIGKFFSLEFSYGGVTLKADRLQLTTFSDSAIGSNFGKDVTFRNVGKSTLTFT